VGVDDWSLIGYRWKSLVMTFTVSHGFSMALIEIDCLAFVKMGDFPWRTVSHNNENNDHKDDCNTNDNTMYIIYIYI
jgi:hypothetical protein